MTAVKKKKLTRAGRVIKFIETHCCVPEGDNKDIVGKPVKLAEFQKKFIIDVYDNPAITDTAILSIARKNAKTALIAFIVLAHLVGPEAVENSRIVSGALSKEQASEVYNYAMKSASFSPKLRGLVRAIPSQKKLVGILMNVEYQAISADAKTAHGKSPILAVLDEVGQVVGPTSGFFDAITTAQGGYTAPILMYISTQAATDADYFSIQIDDALNNKPPKTVCHVYAADEGCDLMDESQWLKANPALGLFRSEPDMRKQAERAVRMPSAENTFRNLNLNQRVQRQSPFINQAIWKKCGVAVDPARMEDCDEVYGGLDLSARTDLTAFVLIGLKDGLWHCKPYFWTPEIGLYDRAQKDRAPYDLWNKQGFLYTTPGRTVDYEFVAKEMAEITENITNLRGIAFDRWRFDILKKELERIKCELPMVPWGQGFKDMGPAVEAVEDILLNELLRHHGHPVLTMCASHSVVSKDSSGSKKLDKAKTSGRIDGMVALAMAAGLSQRPSEEPEDIDEFIDEPLIL